MQITVACHRCDHPKRPLSPCPHCSAAALAEAELHAWRLSLHSRHLARIKATPRPAELPAREPISPGPMRVVLTLEAEPEAPVATVTPIVPLEPPVDADDALEFDWSERRRRRLRRSA